MEDEYLALKEDWMHEDRLQVTIYSLQFLKIKNYDEGGEGEDYGEGYGGGEVFWEEVGFEGEAGVEEE